MYAICTDAQRRLLRNLYYSIMFGELAYSDISDVRCSKGVYDKV